MLNTLFSEGLTRPAPYVDGLDAVAAAVADFTPEAAERASGVPADVIVRIARELAAADGAAAYGRMGVSTQEFGLVCQWAVQLLNLVTGNTDRVGGVMLTSPAIDAVGRGLLGRGHYDKFRSRVRQAPEFGELPVSVLREEIETPGEGQVRALLTIAGNPVLSTPDGAALDRALEGLDFCVAVDIYLNETTRHADVILPPTTLLERDHYDLPFHVLAVRDTARFTPAVFPKGRDQRHDWEIFRDLYVRVTRRLERKAPLKRRLMTEARLRLSPTLMVGMLLRTGRSGVTISQLRKHPEGVDIGPLRGGQLPERLFTKDKRIKALPAHVADDLARLRAQELPTGDELLLIGRRHQRDCNSWMHNTDRLTRGKPRHHLLMHPADLDARGLRDGAVVTVTSRVGKVEVEVRATEDVMPGVVSLPHGYGHQREGCPARDRHGCRRGVDQRPDRPRADGRLRQRRTVRRTGDRHVARGPHRPTRSRPARRPADPRQRAGGALLALPRPRRAVGQHHRHPRRAALEPGRLRRPRRPAAQPAARARPRADQRRRPRAPFPAPQPQCGS